MRITEFLPKIFWGFLIFWTLTLALWIYIYSIRSGGIPEWDGYERCSAGAQIWYDLHHGDWHHFWYHTHRLVIWPFLHSWVTGFLFLIFGPSIATARLISLFSFVLITGLILYHFTKKKTDEFSFGLLVTWCLFTTAPLVMINTANAMSEMPGLMLVMATLVFLPKKDPRPLSRWLPSAFFLTLLFYFKYNFSALTYIGLLLYRAAKANYSPKIFFTPVNALLLGLPLGIFSLWFLRDTAYKWTNFIGFATNNPRLYSPWGSESLLFYPHVIPSSYFVFSSLFWGTVFLALFTLPWNPHLRLRNPFFTCFLIHFLAAVAHPMKMDRFQFVPMGLWFVVTGETVQWLAARWIARFSWRPERILSACCVLLLIPTVYYQSNAYRRAQTPQGQPTLAPLQAVLDEITDTDRTALLIPYDYICAPSVTYYFVTQKDKLDFDQCQAIRWWSHIFLFLSRDAILSQSPEERLRTLNQVIDTDHYNKIVFIEQTFPPPDPMNFDRAYGGAEEIGKIVASTPRFQVIYDKQFPLSKARVRIFSIADKIAKDSQPNQEKE